MIRSRIQPNDGDPRHGTQNGYVNLWCRCEDCTEAWRVYHREYMNRDPNRLAKQAQAQRLRDKVRRSK